MKIGTVIDNPQVSSTSEVESKVEGKVEYQGQYYDYVFDVDIADGHETLKLPYNMTQSPSACASQFLLDHNLPGSYLQTIIDFIIANTPDPDQPPQDPKKRPRSGLPKRAYVTLLQAKFGCK